MSDIPGVPTDEEALNSDGSVYEVYYSGVSWVVEKKSTMFGQTKTPYQKKKTAVDKAKSNAKREGGKVIIKKKDGSVQNVVEY